MTRILKNRNRLMDSSATSLSREASRVSKENGRKLDASRRSELGQFFTPWDVAAFMATFAEVTASDVKILDPGAGTGILSAAIVANLAAREVPPKSIAITAYELDSDLRPALVETMRRCEAQCAEAGIRFTAEVRSEDFIESGVRDIAELGELAVSRFHLAILNPPYRKLASDSWHRALLREVGIETSNLYTSFVSLALRMLVASGELVAITPRSFCNGTYFRQFRSDLLSRFRFRRIHVFERRDDAFGEDDVLQENIIFSGVRATARVQTVAISASNGDLARSTLRAVPAEHVIRPDDREAFIHIVPEEERHTEAERLRALRATLSKLGLSVSTGRVVDFRAREWLRSMPGEGDVPLIYPHHFVDGFVEWPRPHAKKANAIAATDESASLLVPAGVYVLIKRFSAKEEPRRVVAAILDTERFHCSEVGIENHLNYIHGNGRGIEMVLARGIAAYLNSTIFDSYFRQFSGHTQVNATDLRNVAFPSHRQLVKLGVDVGDESPTQELIDARVEGLLDEITFSVPA